jgi:SAM-dependent methyltransferase
LVPAQGVVLDVACGEGRHLAWFVQRGHPVVGVESSAAALAGLGLPAERCETVLADIEQGPWPLQGRQFAAVVVTNYLWRPLLPTIAQSVAPGGVLIYETFGAAQARIGKPSRPEFLLQPGELLTAFAGLRTVAFEDGFEAARPGWPERFVQRLVAVREDAQAPGAEPARHVLG